MSTTREPSREPLAERRPPTLRRAWVIRMTVLLLCILALVLLLIPPIRAASGGGGVSVLLILLVSTFSGVLTRAATKKLAAKAPGLCPACEYTLDVTAATPADEPVRCPECGYADTAGGVRMFWEVHVGKPSP